MNIKKELIKYLSLSIILLVSSFASAQQSVSGSISDGDGPLPGVTVIEKEQITVYHQTLMVITLLQLPIKTLFWFSPI